MTVLVTFDAIDLTASQLPGSPQSRSKIKDGSFLIDDDNSYKPSPPKSEPPKKTPSKSEDSTNNSSDYESPKNEERDRSEKPTYYQQETYTVPNPDEQLPSVWWVLPAPFKFNPPPVNRSPLIRSFTPTYTGEIFIGTEGTDLVELTLESSALDRLQGIPVSGGTLLGLAGNDGLFGDSGNDVLSGGNGNDLLDGSSGNDVIFGGEGDDTLHGGSGINSLYGNAGKDIIYGSWDSEQLQGGKGRDLLRGYEGNDSLFGGKDQDLLIGDTGDDRFILSAKQGEEKKENADMIGDFSKFAKDEIFIIAAFRKDEIYYKSIDKYDGQDALPSEYVLEQWRSLTSLDSTAIVAPNGNILGVVFNVTDVAAIQNAITVVPTLADAITL